MTEISISFGFPRMRVEASERRDFLPETTAHLQKLGAAVFMEHGSGAGMGYSEEDYLSVAPATNFVSHEEAYQKDYVVVLRCPEDDDLRLLKQGGCLVSMLHYPTRPIRTEYIKSLGVEAISLDSIKDDVGRRLVENLHAVAWNGVEVAFRTLRTTYPPPGFENPAREPIRVTLLGAGAVGAHVLQAAIRYGNIKLWKEMYQLKVPGVQVTAIDYDTTCKEDFMLEILSHTDLLIDATQRSDPAKPVVLNKWIQVMPEHAVLLDLSVDPYDCEDLPRSVKGIEGIPQGNLDQYIFPPDDPVYDTIPDCVQVDHRRYVVSCYSWPGIHPRKCMLVYNKQLRPVFRKIVEKGKPENINKLGSYFERAIYRALLSKQDLS